MKIHAVLFGFLLSFGLPTFAQQAVVRDAVTNCTVVINAPANTSDFKLGRVETFGSRTACAADGTYNGQIAFAYSFTFINSTGKGDTVQGWRYGYAEQGAMTGVFINAFLGDFRIIVPNKSATLFRQSDASYSLDGLKAGIDMAAAETTATRFNAEFVKGMANVWNNSTAAFYRVQLERQSDDLPVFGRGARGG